MANPQNPILIKHLDSTIHLKAREAYEIYISEGIAEQMGRKPVKEGRYYNLFYQHRSKDTDHLDILDQYLKKGIIPKTVMATAIEDAFLSGSKRQQKWARRYLQKSLNGH